MNLEEFAVERGLLRWVSWRSREGGGQCPSPEVSCKPLLLLTVPFWSSCAIMLGLQMGKLELEDFMSFVTVEHGFEAGILT